MKKEYTVNVDLYWWFERHFEDCYVQVTGTVDLENIDLATVIVPDVQAKIVDPKVLAYMKSLSIDVAETEAQIQSDLLINPEIFIECIYEAY